MELTTLDRIALGTITTRTEAGRHFTEIWPDSWLTRMEAAGYLAIARPIHNQTGLPYSREYWHVEVAAEVPDWFAGGVLVGGEDLYDESGEYPGDIVEQVEALEAVRRAPVFLTGLAALEWAESHGRNVWKHADPIEGGSLVSPDEAREIAREDPALLAICPEEPGLPPWEAAS